MGLDPGASIGANVRLIQPLSRGGMGSVWRAEHLTLHTEVAVKFVSDALIGDQGFLARFTREAVASARIKSPHVVQIFDHGVTTDGVPYIVMELLEGEDLRARLLRDKKLSIAAAAQVVAQVARGLSRAHAASIVHRDIKPGNIFLMEQDGELFAKILDFGIAKQVGDTGDQVTITGQIIGTPHYLSPEQIQRPRDADPQSDLWSLAVVAYRCLTGEMPFEGESVGAVAIAVDKAAYVPVTQREPALPKMLDAWFARAFARAPSARFGSAKELCAAFEAASRDEPLPSAAAESSAQVDVPPPARASAPANEAPGTPLPAGEPTISQGTVTHVDLASPRRTKLVGAGIAGVAILGAVTVGVLSRGDGAAAPAATITGPDAPAATPSAAGSAEIAPATAPATLPAPSAEPTVTARPAASQARSAASTASGPPPKKKKDRGF